ncbi:MAG: COQ9 family protein [Alphaproteobacteria bacterium]|jgi:ubiquinone biosynthesis protein COQ9|nr:COQ9 family protein [Alphaproteobacteria bacterium]MBT4082838.1 COQ9 family protein [Alphaproteobacteria bacterium]MBT4542424.1 COQ9 family protein [Alphaproteobacteria bacterium]MBT7744985.1 COQ9 family protein [Alphaproteobacteria bacterium]
MNTTSDDAKTRSELLQAALDHVPFDGWSKLSMDRANDDLKLPPGTVHRLFPRGPRELLTYSSQCADQQMLEGLSATDLGSLKIRERIALAVKLRLQADVPHREAVARAATWLALPGHHVTAGRLLYATVDNMWHGIGDTSVDFNFYSKRALLAGVVSSTVLFWLQDESDDFSATWAFLDRRIEDVMKIQKTKAQLGNLVEKLPFIGRLMNAASMSH